MNTESDDATAQAILRYLAEQPTTMDTVDGITQWWEKGQRRHGSTSAIARALDGLLAKGLIEELDDEEPRRYRLKRHSPPS